MNWQRREGRLELPNDLPLPLRVQMKLQLVDQHDRLTLAQRIIERWIRLR